MKYSLNINLLSACGIFFLEFISYYYNKTHYNDFRFTLQYMEGVLVWVISAALIYLNIWGYGKSKEAGEKLARVIFAAIGVMCFLYITFALVLQYGFRHGVGF